MMKYTPRPEQQAAIDHAVDFLLSAPPGAKQLYAGPTGIGKSVIELCIREKLMELGHLPYIITPREEIVVGMLDKLGTDDSIAAGIWTPVMLRNRLLSGSVAAPTHLIFDETHHHEATTWQQLDLLTGLVPSIGLTASPYRGGSRSTRKFRETWGDPTWIITYEEAIAAGHIKLPAFHVLPLVDDDVVEVSGGEFKVESIESATMERIDDLVAHAAEWYSAADRQWDKATIFSFPSSRMCREFQGKMAAKGAPVVCVTAETPRADRQTIFDATERRILALVHINVVQEGVDLKLERLVDASPTMSPVKWVQQIGRIMRPTTERDPEYICTNRNVLRHSYILDGVVPMSAIVEAERKFPPTERHHGRVLGMEAIGRFKPSTTKLISGSKLYVYNMSAMIGRTALEFACLVHPNKAPIWACRANGKDENDQRVYGQWRRCEAPESITGFSSASQRAPSEKQMGWWRRSAHRHGLDPEQEVDRKSFAALPVLADIGEYLE